MQEYICSDLPYYIEGDQIAKKLKNIQQGYEKVKSDLQLSDFLEKHMDSRMKLKKLPESGLQFTQECVKNAIKIIINQQFRVGTQALRHIFDTGRQFYKYNNIDNSLNYPLGKNRPLNWDYEPSIGQQCDVVRPYITSTSFCTWTRCTLLSKDNNKYTIHYLNTDCPITQNRPYFSPLSSRTLDFQWRNNLAPGSLVDAHNKVWYRATVIDMTIQNGSKRVQVGYRVYNQNGAYKDSQNYSYDGLGPSFDFQYDLYSERIQKPGKMAKQFCQYSHLSEQFVIDDTYDLIFQQQYQQKSFEAIMRLNFTRSVSFLHFYQFFCQNNGFQAFDNALENVQIPIDNIMNLIISITNTSFLIPRMGLNYRLPSLLNKVIKYTKQNCKLITPSRLDVINYFVDNISKRIKPLSVKHALHNDLKRCLALELLKMNMEKQMIALRLLYELIKPMKQYTKIQMSQLLVFLKNNDIFYQLIRANVHEQIVARSVELLRFMLIREVIGWKEVEHIWSIVPQSDLRGRATTEKLIGELAKQFPQSYTERILDKLLLLKETELTNDNLNLLRILKDQTLSKTYTIKLMRFLWDCITIKSANIKPSIQQEIEKVFKGFIASVKENQIRIELLNMMVLRLSEVSNVGNEIELLKGCILAYPKDNMAAQSKNSEAPQTLQEVVQYLKKQEIYQKLLSIFYRLKNVEKIKNVLNFIGFLFQYDKDDVSEIVQKLYEIMGPTDIFLERAQKIVSRAPKFFRQLFSANKKMDMFEKLSSSGLTAIKKILFDLNQSEGTLKIITRITASASVQTNTTNQDSKNKVYGPDILPQTIIFMYVLKSPFQIIGLNFLEQLLLVVKNNIVYESIITLIIQFIVCLDHTIQQKALAFREIFLSNIFSSIIKLLQENIFSDQIKLKLQIYVNLIQYLFAQTEINGLGDIKPHFQRIQSEPIRIQIKNSLVNNTKFNQFEIQVHENITFWSLKKKVAQILNQNPNTINVNKSTFYCIGDNNNGKSLVDLFMNNSDTMEVTRKLVKQIPRQDLLMSSEKQLTPKFNKIVDHWFDTYKNHQGFMGIDQLKALSGQCWKGSLLRESSKLNDMLKSNDSNGKGYLTREQFKQFFITKSATNASALWKIINLSGYNNNFIHKNQKVHSKSDNQLPRKILSVPRIYQVLYELLKNPSFQPVHLNYYRLLQMLQSDQCIRQQLMNMNQQNQNNILNQDKCAYQFSYIIEAIIAQSIENRNFFLSFYKRGGLKIVSQKLIQIMNSDDSIYGMEVLMKTIILPNMIKICNIYIAPLCMNHKSSLFIKENKLNVLELKILQKKYQQMNTKSTDFSLFDEMTKISNHKLFDEYFPIAKKLLNNLTSNYKEDLLLKITNQTIRFYALLAISSDLFDPSELLPGLKCESQNIRRGCENIIYLCLGNDVIRIEKILEQFLEHMPTQSKSIYSNYFELLEKILQKLIQLGSCTDEKLIQLVNRLFSKMFQQVKNQLRTAVLTDKVLLGILSTINLILGKRSSLSSAFSSIKPDLMKKCLFFYNAQERISSFEVTNEMLKNEYQQEHFEDYVKCKTQQTRKQLMQIVIQLHRMDSQRNIQFLNEFILPIVKQLPSENKKTSPKYMHVGLNNLGSTCYINSMMQVLNSISPFRNAIMMSDHQGSMLMYRLQELFSYLFFSERSQFVPDDFLQAFTPSINIGVQQDTTQFLNLMFDQLETHLKGTPFFKVFSSIFRGNQVAQMICHTCKAKRERVQEFLTYGVQIQNKYDLYEALDGMHNGQLISDCLCESCGHKSDTTKRNILNKVPNVFFIHLKRIVFNYDVFINTKIHTRLFFPENLNFEPYTKEGIQLRENLGVEYLKNLKENQEQMKKFQEMQLHQKHPDYYKLKLKAIIVHSGTPDLGHYYTILQKDKGWIKFDDSRISTFGQSNFQSQCYGGVWTSDEWGSFGSSTNAYVLVYEKELKQDLIIGNPNGEQVIIPDSKLQTYNTSYWYKKVWMDNHHLMLQNQMFSDRYSKDFMTFIQKMLELTPQSQQIIIISEIFFKICFNSGQCGNLLVCLNKNLQYFTPEILQEYLFDNLIKSFNTLFHNSPKVRQFAALYFEKVLINSYRLGDAKVCENVMKFINNHLASLGRQIAKNWLRIDGFFKMLFNLVCASQQFPEMWAYFINQHLISQLIDFVLEKMSPINLYQKKYSVGTKTTPVDFKYALNLIYLLLSYSKGFTGHNQQVPIEAQYDLSNNDMICLSYMPFYQKMIKQKQDGQNLTLIIQHLCTNNIYFSQAISIVLLKCVNQIMEPREDTSLLFSYLTAVLSIKDQYWLIRFQHILGYCSPYINQDNTITNLSEDRFVYNSTISDIFPFQCLLSYAFINRQKLPLSILYLIEVILQSCTIHNESINFLVTQISCCYNYQRYLDWIPIFLSRVVGMLNLDKQLKIKVENTVTHCQQLLKIYQSRKNEFPMPGIITGLIQLQKKTLVQRVKCQNINVELLIYDISAWAVQSSPTGQSNATLDHYLNNGKLQQKVTSSSTINKFMKQMKKALALKNQQMEEEEDKQIISLFDEYPSQSGSGGDQIPQELKGNKLFDNIDEEKIKDKSEKIEEQIIENSNKQLSKTQNIDEQNKNIDQKDVNKKIQNDKIQIEEVQINVIEQIWLEKQYFKMLEIVNNSQSTKEIKINFSNCKQSNSILPSQVAIQVSKNKSQTIWTCKYNHQKPWGPNQCTLEVGPTRKMKQACSFSFKNYNNEQYQTVTQKTEQKESDYKQNKQGQTSEINCPACTAFNPISNQTCFVCQSSLNQAQ